MATSSRDIMHLYRRVGFGSSPAQRAAVAGESYEDLVRELVARARTTDDAANAVAVPKFSDPGDLAAITDPKQRQAAVAQRARTDHQENAALASWWIDRMVRTDNPLREKATFILHDHFATSADKVKRAPLMYQQHQVLRTQGLGNFESLVQSLAVDPAMLLWLDGNDNVAKSPNENFARELFELFTLGVGHYGEQDIKEAARAFTGWAYNRRDGKVALRARQHDNGTKTVLGQTGNLSGTDVVRIATHRDDTARRLAAKWWSRLAYPVSVDDPIVAALAAGFAASLDTGALIEAILLHDAFRSDTARTGLVKTPVEYVAGTLRAFGLTTQQVNVVPVLEDLGQVPFRPPSVGGWPQNAAWLTTATAVTRAEFVGSVVGKADLGAINNTAAAQRPAFLADLLGVEVWSDATRDVLARAAKDVRIVTALALIAPEYLVN